MLLDVWYETMTSVIKDALTMFINSNLNCYSTCCRTAHKEDLADKKTLREHTTLSKNKEKKRRGKEIRKNVITRRNLTQDKATDETCPKINYGIHETYVDDWIGMHVLATNQDVNR